MRRRLVSLTIFLAAWCGAARAQAAPKVWAIDDGEKIRRDAVDAPFATGQDNPVWSPGQPVRVSALQNETVGLQIVVGADDAALSGVTVDLAKLAGPGGAVLENDASATDPTRFVGRRIERFVEQFVEIKRPSGNNTNAAASLGWRAGAGPAPATWVGFVPDALIPVEIAPSWAPYPMQIAPRQNGIVWIDVTIPKTQAPGVYTGEVVVKAGATELARLGVELKVYGVVLPDLPRKTMVYYEQDSLQRRIGNGPVAEEQLFKILHRHRLSAMHQALAAGDVTRQLASLDGTLYTPQNGYEGPGIGEGDGIVSLGTYGDYGAPDAADLAQVEGVADLLAQKGLRPKTDVFVYAIDETCGSPYGQGWVDLLASSSNPNAKTIPVGWTCYQNPNSQPVNIPIVPGDFYNPGTAATAKAAGKRVWAYNGRRPHSGTFMTDTEAVSLRVNGWLQGMFDIERWFYWESIYWYDGGRGGLGPVDPFVTAENFHNWLDDYCMGDGMLLYPGKQVDMFTTHSIGADTLITSIRLKNLRRGVQDAGYIDLARAVDRAKTDAIVRKVMPKVLSEVTSGQPTWGERGKPFYDARMEMLALVPKAEPPAGPPVPGAGADGGVGGENPAGPNAPAGGGSSGGCGCTSAGAQGALGAGGATLALAVALAARRRRRR